MRLFTVLSAAMLGAALFAGTATAQDVQERTIRWGHLNNTDHPVSFGVQKFAEILAAKSGGGERRDLDLGRAQLVGVYERDGVRVAVRHGEQFLVSADGHL